MFAQGNGTFAKDDFGSPIASTTQINLLPYETHDDAILGSSEFVVFKFYLDVDLFLQKCGQSG
jgi:hypothetical protein